MAPTRRPPLGSFSTWAMGRSVMSTRVPGCSTSSFIRSTSVVPPAMNLPLAPAAVSIDVGFRYVKVCMATSIPMGRLGLGLLTAQLLAVPLLGSHLLDRRQDVGIGAAAADIAGHGLLDLFFGGADGLLQQGYGGHDLAG